MGAQTRRAVFSRPEKRVRHKAKATVIGKKSCPELREHCGPGKNSGSCPCCSDKARPVIFKTERTDYEENG